MYVPATSNAPPSSSRRGWSSEPRAQSNSTVAPSAVTVRPAPGPPHAPTGTSRSAGRVTPVVVVVTPIVDTAVGDGTDGAVVTAAEVAVDAATEGVVAAVTPSPSELQATSAQVNTSAARETSLTNPHATVIR